jgi:hypothetical protein
MKKMCILLYTRLLAQRQPETISINYERAASKSAHLQNRYCNETINKRIRKITKRCKMKEPLVGLIIGT